jgi:hypothetical protein
LTSPAERHRFYPVIVEICFKEGTSMGFEQKKSFDVIFKELVDRTCKQWGYNLPSHLYYVDVYKRLPEGLRDTISHGYSKGIILDAGLSETGSAAFRPSLVPDSKGPYSWFERDNRKRQPRPAWEYYIQVSEYVRLYEGLGEKYELRFEDDLMDIGIYENNALKVCCEIKETSNQAQILIRGIREFQNAEKLPEKDRGNDPLRKAKYITKLKPKYFYVVSIGRRFEFRVEYPEKAKFKQFKLIEDLIPFI